MSTEFKIKKFKVKMIADNYNDLVKGEIYEAYIPKEPTLLGVPFYGVFNKFGEDYAYPASMFEVVEENDPA